MDIREYMKVLQAEKRFFFTVAAGIWLVSLLWFLFQPVSFQGTLLLNIGRTANEPSTEYSYDSFYRLQADERFADTLVRWLQNPRIVSDILNNSGSSTDQYSEEGLQSIFDAKRLSSQVVEVRFGASTREAIEGYSQSLVETTQRYTESLNATQVNWFRVSGSEPIIRDGRIPAYPFLVLTALIALFIAFWAVLIKHYFKAPDNITQ